LTQDFRQNFINETNLDIPELESCIIDAKRFLEHLPTFWINLSHGQKRKMTEFLFPKGLIWDGKEYRTPEIHPIFNSIDEVIGERNQLVETAGIEPASRNFIPIHDYKHIRLDPSPHPQSRPKREWF